MYQTCVAHNRDDDREDRNVLFNGAVNYKDYVASVACALSRGGMLLTGEEGPVAAPLGPPVARTHRHSAHVCLVQRHLVLHSDGRKCGIVCLRVNC